MNPYEVLGIDSKASQAEIKTAYRTLVKKYHPDKYVDNPLGDLAEEKLQQINQAYDMITGSNSTSSSSSTNSSTAGSYGNVSYGQIRQLINANQINQAIAALDGISTRNAEWYYLRGICMSKLGMYAQANSFFSTAQRMDPSNQEYARAATNMKNSNDVFTRQATTTGANGCSTCNICSGLICADCCCECAGGDLIGCC